MADQEIPKKKFSPEELQALANEQGMELTESQLDQIAGGWDIMPTYITCENCGRKVNCEDSDVWVYCTGCGHKNGPFKTS